MTDRDPIGELRREVHELRRANDRRRPTTTSKAGAHPRLAGSVPPWGRVVHFRRRQRQRRLGLVLGLGVAAIIAIATLGLPSTRSFALPSHGALAGMNVGQRVVAIANSQVGYSATPSHSYCNKFSAYWDAGAPSCPAGARSEEWCADFAAWAWRTAGVRFTYGFGPGDLNAGAVSFYQWGVDNGAWHPATSGYVAAPGDVAIYGLSLGAVPSASHVAIVTHDSHSQRGPDVINGDGNRTGFSVVESGTDQVHADVSRGAGSTLAGYVSLP